MKTRRTLQFFFFTMMLAFSAPSVHASTPETKEAQIQRIELRLEEIKATDMKQLSRSERKALKGEVKELKKEMKAASGGVYISVGAIILIALLIILLA